jgi:hypothetical protein
MITIPVIASPGPAEAGNIRYEQLFVIARSASDEAISAALDLTRLLHSHSGFAMTAVVVSLGGFHHGG